MFKDEATVSRGPQGCRLTMQISSWPAKRETPFPSSSLLEVSHYLHVRTPSLETRQIQTQTHPWLFPTIATVRCCCSLLLSMVPPVDDVCLSFERVGDTYLLSEVKAQVGTYTIAKRPRLLQAWRN